MIRQAEKPAGFFSLPSFGGNTKTPEEVVCVPLGGMAKTFTLDVARRALAKAKATRINSIIPICTLVDNATFNAKDAYNGRSSPA